MNENGNHVGSLKGKYVRLIKKLTQKPLSITDFEEIIGFCADETQCGYLILTNVLHRAFFSHSEGIGSGYVTYATWYRVREDKAGNLITTIFENSQRFDTIIPLSEKPIEYETAAQSYEVAKKAAEDKGDNVK